MAVRVRFGMTVVAVLAVLVAGCATRFSPATIRDEIQRQRGGAPLSVFELSLGRFTTLLIKTALADESGAPPFAGLQQLQLAVYEAPAEQGPAIDVTRIAVRGWEPVIRSHADAHSALILIRSASALPWVGDETAGSIGDLVVVGAGRRKVVYARLRGSLSPELPTTLGDVLRDRGPEEVQRVLTELLDPGDPGSGL